MMKKLKGFTLLELIIVMAIFSIIMYSAVQLLSPVSKFLVRSTNFENTTACMDNMRRCVEGNLKYADRVRPYSGYFPYTYTDADYKTIAVTDDLKDKVIQFYRDYFEDRCFIDASGTINVLVFDNTELMDDTTLNSFKNISDYTDKVINQGKIVLLRFPFDNYAGTDVHNLTSGMLEPELWCVNQKMYSNFDYRFSLDAVSDEIVNANTNTLVSTDASVTAPSVGTYLQYDAEGNPVTDASNNFVYHDAVFFDPSDFNISISMREIKRSPTGLIRNTPTTASVASFSMKNVLNAADGYRTAALDYKTVLRDGSEGGDHNYRAIPVPRYEGIDDAGTGFDGFYFIFTLPEEIFDHYDDAAMWSQEYHLNSSTS